MPINAFEKGGPEETYDQGHLLHTLIDNMPDFIYIKDRSSRFILANKKAASNHGLESGSQLIGTTDHDFYSAELADKYYKNEQDIMKSGQPLIDIEEKGRNEKGEQIYLSTTKIPFRDREGKIIGIVGIGRDITARKKAEMELLERTERLQQLNTLLEEKREEIQQQAEELAVQADHLQAVNQELEKMTVAVTEADNVILILDDKGNFEWVNRSFTRVYGQTLKAYTEQFGRNIAEGGKNPQFGVFLEKCRESGKTMHYQSETTDHKGEKIWTQSTLTPVFDPEGKIIRFVAIDADITALKKAEDLIKKQKTELEIRGRELEKANLTKDKFFSIIAHDLKNPFHTIIGFSELLLRDYKDLDDQRKREYLRLINESSQQANTLLENLLNWSRTQTGRIQCNPSLMELNSTVHQVRGRLHSAMKSKEIVFENKVPVDTPVWADQNMIRTVLRNLMSNAVKFTPPKGRLEVSSEKDAGRVTVRVSDTGVGIAKDKLDKLFDLGELSTTQGTDGEQGTGLGLLICHEFVIQNGGTLNVSSQEGKGSTFSFDLPCSEPQKEELSQQ